MIDVFGPLLHGRHIDERDRVGKHNATPIEGDHPTHLGVARSPSTRRLHCQSSSLRTGVFFAPALVLRASVLHGDLGLDLSEGADPGRIVPVLLVLVPGPLSSGDRHTGLLSSHQDGLYGPGAERPRRHFSTAQDPAIPAHRVGTEGAPVVGDPGQLRVRCPSANAEPGDEHGLVASFTVS